jgi:hypothetical protein
MAAYVIPISERTVDPAKGPQLATRPRFRNGAGRQEGKMYTRHKDETRPTDLDLEMAIFAAP